MVFAMAAVLWGVGSFMGAPRRVRANMISFLIAGVLFIQVMLPDGHPLREATGGDARLWLLLLAGFVLVKLYRGFLGKVKTRAAFVQGQVPDRTASGAMSDTQLDRYARHIVLREIGGYGQRQLQEAKVLVVGAGGLGSAALQYLAAGGVGTLGVIDDDVVDNSNLQRQVLHRDADIGTPKTVSAAQNITALNPFVTVRPYNRRLDTDIAEELVAEYDLVLDGSDNSATRYAVNAACVATQTPLVSAAMTQWEGQISVFDPAKGGPCYACVFPVAADPALVPSCAEAGIIGPLPGIMGSLQAVEAMKIVTGAGEALRGRLLIYDALYAEQRVIAVAARTDCAICGGRGAD